MTKHSASILQCDLQVRRYMTIIMKLNPMGEAAIHYYLEQRSQKRRNITGMTLTQIHGDYYLYEEAINKGGIAKI